LFVQGNAARLQGPTTEGTSWRPHDKQEV